MNSNFTNDLIRMVAVLISAPLLNLAFIPGAVAAGTSSTTANEPFSYCYEGDAGDQCFTSFKEALDAATAAAHGHKLTLTDQSFISRYVSGEGRVPMVAFRYEATELLPPETFLPSAFEPSTYGTDLCSSYGYPFGEPKCSSEEEFANDAASELCEGQETVRCTPIAIEGSWDQFYFFGPIPDAIGTPSWVEGYGMLLSGTKTARFRLDYEDGSSDYSEQNFLQYQPYRCPAGRVSVMNESGLSLNEINLQQEGWPNVCEDPYFYVITRRINYACDPCENEGTNPSIGSQSVRESLISLDGVEVGLSYQSILRSWVLDIEKKIDETIGGPVLEFSPGKFVQLISTSATTYAVNARPNELVWVNGDWTYSYRTSGYEYRFDSSGLIASFGPIGTVLTKVIRDDDDRIISVKTPNGRVINLVYTFSRLTGISGGGQSTNFSYDSSDNLSEINGDAGYQRRFLYGESGLAAASDPNLLTGILSGAGQREHSFGYDAPGRLIYRSSGSVGNEVGVASYAYPDATHAVVETASGGTRMYEFSDDIYRRLVSVTDSAGTASHEYDTNNRLTRRTDTLGSITNYGYAPQYENNRTVAVGAPQQRRIETDRDTKFGKVKARRVYDVAGTLAAKQTWTYNTRGQELTATRTDPATNAVRTTTTTYCESVNVTAGTCPRVGLATKIDGPRTDVADSTTYTYYPGNGATCAAAPLTCPYRKGDLWKVTNALGQVTETLKYDAAGRTLSIKDANGVVTDFEYHPRGWLAARKTRGGNDTVETDDTIVRLEYWPTGLVKKVTQPDGAFTTYTYNSDDRLTDIADNGGNTIHYTLNNAGKRIQEDTKDSQDNLKRTLSRVFNQLGQLKVQADAQANPTDFTYDANGNTDTVTDALDRVTDNDYDPLNRLSRTLQDVGGIDAETKFTYDALDNLTRVIDPKGLNTDYTYNGLDDLTQLSSPDTGTTTYTYDSAGNRQTQTDARGQTSTYSYDALNRLTGIAYATPSLDMAYTYDATQAACVTGETFSIGRLTRLSDASGSTQYCYDRFGNLVRKVQTTNGIAFTVRYAYTLAGQLSSVTYPDGAIASYVRDGQGRTTQVNVQRTGAATEVLLEQASYHAFGPVASWTYGNGRQLQRPLNQNYQPVAIQDAGVGGLSVGFQYDPVGNLTQLTPAASATPLVKFDYDALSRLTAFKDGPTDVAIESYVYDATGNRQSFNNAAGTQAYTYPSTSHRLSQVGAIARTYDNAGNTTAIGGIAKEFNYDDTGRMSQVIQNAIVQRNYAYNGKGEQVRKHLGTSNTYTVYDEVGHWLGDYDNTGAALQQAIWLDDLPVGLIANGNQLHYIEPDHLGTPRVIIEVVRNVPVWKWDLRSEAFGNGVQDLDPDGDANSFVFDMRFPGQRYDAASGLNYNYFRDGYDASTGRYTQSDPVGLMAGVSTYGYVSGSPLVWFDMYGLLQWTTNPIVWSPTLVPGLQTRTFPGDGASTVTGSSLARTTLDWSISSACTCATGGFSLDEYKVNFTPIVFLRQRYDSFDQRRDSRRAELDHVRDFNGWIGGARTAAQALEDSMKGQSFASAAECENAARQAMQQLLQAGARQTAIDSHNRWDASGRHTQVIPGP